MTVIEAIVIGLVQGITEILPISSTAHILLLADVFNVPEPSIAATVFLNFGSFLAIIVFFRAYWLRMFRGTRIVMQNWLQQKNSSSEDQHQAKYVLFLIIATIPAVIIGALFEDIIENTLRSSWSIAAALMGGGLLLFLADMMRRVRTLPSLNTKQAFIVGCFQALALIPGFSRSGSAITGARFLNYERSDAATFAFLMGAPVLIAAMVYQMPVLVQSGALQNGALWVAFCISIVSTYIAIRFIMGFIRRRSYLWFVAYRFILGGGILALLFSS